MSRIYLSPPHLGPDERDLLLEALESNWIAPLGPHVDAFERELADVVGVPHALALSSGTAALHLALRLAGVGPGDEVLVSTLTFVASVNPIRYLGATPVFIDSDRRSWNMDPALLEAELSERAARGALPKAVVVVDLYGQCADYAPIVESCRRHGVLLIEDAAEALGASYQGRPAGSFGDLSVFSFNGNKIITTSGGGMLVSRRKDWIDEARFLSTQARDEAPHYQHSRLGYNYRMSNLLAAVGRGQLRQLPERVARRRAHNAGYRARLERVDGIELMPEAPGGHATFWLTALTVDPARVGCDREQIRRHLETLDIEARPVWKPMHLQPLYEGCRCRGGAVAQALFETGLCLPSGSSLSDADRERVADEVLAALGQPG
jgi:pyridoxal phosphate-dependent aminotransferase EpsN